MIGFVILSHRSAGQLMRLCRTLNVLYDNPPISCHHDFAQSPIEIGDFPSNVRFVEPSIRTAWAKWSLVEATLSALRLLYDFADPDHFYLISAADYPIARRETVERDLASHSADAFIDAFALEEALRGNVSVGDLHLAHHRAEYNLKLERQRYLQAEIWLPIIRFRPQEHSTTTERYPRIGRITKTLPFSALNSPFNPQYKCFVGSQWFTANRKVALHLISPSVEDRKLQRYYRSRIVPDESYFQTVICNAPHLTWQDRTFRYAIWDGAHPIDLNFRHFDAIKMVKAHFARKFQENDPLLDLLDESLGVNS